MGAGGYSRLDGTVQFYSRVRALLEPEMVVADLGAGRGEPHLDDPIPYRRRIRMLKGRCAKVIGLDPDPVVRTNPSLDEAHVIATEGEEAGRLPLPDASVDMVLSDFTFEHVDEPAGFAAEIERILRPGGWLCARTPNRWGYISIGARLIPDALHSSVLARVQPGRKEEDIFPTVYRLNTRRAIERHFPRDRWSHHSYYWDAPPPYFGQNVAVVAAARAALSLLPYRMAPFLNVFCWKRTAEEAAGR